MPPRNPETQVEYLLSKDVSRRNLLRGFGAAAVGGPATVGVVGEQLMQLDALATQLFIEREDIRPWITYHSDPHDADGFYAAFSGTGLPIGDYMSKIIASDVAERRLCSLGVNDGSHIRVPEIASGLVDRARELRPDMKRLKFVFHGISAGSIVAQHTANYIVQHYSDIAEVIGIMNESGPSGPNTVGGADIGKTLLGQYLVRTHRDVGKGMIYATNMWGIWADQARRDPDAWRDIQICSDDTFASIIPDYARIIDAGYPKPVAGENSTKRYLAAFDGSDKYVRIPEAYEETNDIVGGDMKAYSLAGGGHASGWTKEQYEYYFKNGYERALDDFMSRIAA